MELDEAIALVAGWLDAVHVESAPHRIEAMVRAHTDKDRGGVPAASATPDVLVTRALHESGHAVIAARTGLRVHAARVGVDGGSVEYLINDNDDDEFSRTIANLAGIFAELFAGADPHRQEVLSHSSDLLEARLGVDKSCLALSSRTIATAAATSVWSNWRSIERVAAALGALGELNAAEIAALCARPH